MARIQKKGQSGNAKNYITRTQAIRKLQVSLPDFRRLCIFKGIYPREPRSRKKANKSSTPSTTFYYTRDIQYLLHEPLLEKFRAQKTLAKKIAKALGRNEVGEAVRYEKNLKPKIKLDHIIKERYPTFIDALRDLDDALCTLFLFANFPSVENMPPRMVSRCQRLTMEFEHYLIRTHSLRKSFLSIKGIYYQATIQGQDILWLVPYKFVQRRAPDVDFRIMSTFVEFYATLLGFVNYRLYTSIGLVYPPKLDAIKQAEGAELAAFDLERRDRPESTATRAINTVANATAQAEADKLKITADEDSQTIVTTKPDSVLDTFVSLDPTADSLLQPSLSADASVSSQLFEPLTIFLSRETPRHALEFIVRAFGCKRVAWDSTLGGGSYCEENDVRITHQVIDRPDMALPSPPLTDGDLDEEDEQAMVEARKRNARVPGRIYIQPQWIWDSINAGKLQRPDLFGPGATLPPHLSPWMKSKPGEYDPTKSLAEQETETERDMARIEDEHAEDDEEEIDEVEEEEEASDDEDDEGEEMRVELADSSDEDEQIADKPEGFGGFSGDEDEDDAGNASMRAHQDEIEAEVLGRKVINKTASKSKKLKDLARQHERQTKATDAEAERRKMMLPRRKRKQYDQMMYTKAKKDEEAEKLRGKRRKLEKSG